MYLSQGWPVFYPCRHDHAIGAGALVAEIQESSNLTYRLYDYDRIGKDGKKRELHIDKALDVADLHGSAEPRQPLRVLKYRPGMASELLIRCKYFEVYRMLINGVCQEVQRWPVVGNWFRLWPCGYCWTLGSDPIKNGNLFESRKGFFFWTGYAYSPKSVVDAMLKELIYIQERILWIAVWNNVWQNMKG